MTMRYWWVNQNQTYEQEIQGGYLWSPKTKSNGARNHFYDTMKRVEPGDLVFSFRNQHISDVGVATHRAISHPKPEEFGAAGDQWAQDGWLVFVRWQSVATPIAPKNYIEQIRSLLPERYSPLNPVTGHGLQQVYLAEVPRPLAMALLDLIGNDARHIHDDVVREVVDEKPPVESIDELVEQRIREDASLDATTKTAVIAARRGQGRFRRNLEEIEDGCRITGIHDRRLLKASHIKPWRACESSGERLDGNNGLLLSPSIDHLFDQGYLSFEDDGALLLSEQLEPTDLERLGVPLDAGYRVAPFNDAQREYLSYHRQSVFLV
ncbi:HNH endonuclease [Arhodomonas aquaeolei]|uniref:HNH endonuclease n=1 Tax=Arhodomonas aquaeolei TaxID=2369 RepID=UPI0021671AF3|nr:HNH endonuclease [Arhodomonas aquaeolei]MCS4504287.1 HNH endonuclease [Arhodomonas aquaeolei]